MVKISSTCLECIKQFNAAVLYTIYGLNFYGFCGRTRDGLKVLQLSVGLLVVSSHHCECDNILVSSDGPLGVTLVGMRV